MSRIEKALEKAVKMRDSLKDISQKEKPLSEHEVSFTGLDIEEAVINPDVVDKHIVCIKEPHSSVSEQYKKLRARIIKDTAMEFLNTIMVTSPDIGEGKTITAINLSISLANEVDHSVLLVDADLRHPSIHKYLGIGSKKGLSDYLLGKVELQDVLIKTNIGKLIILPAGKSSENAVELLSSERMKRFIHDMKHMNNNRYIILDSSPILVASESIPLSSYMDGIVFVVQAARTKQKVALKALSLIKGSKVFGIVFNNVPVEFARNLYPYYYHYGDNINYKKSKGDKV